MTAQSQIRHVNCTQCGGSLELRGGHKVLSLNCRHCGSVLDPRQDFAVLARFASAQRPATAFEIGARCSFHGVEFTLIGTVGYEAEDSSWLEHLLYSPTHGYMWLSEERGHHILSRRSRDLPSPATAARLDTKDPVRMGGETYRTYERYRARVHYVEGELTWIARQGDSLTITECVAPPKILSYERSGNELEYQVGEYLPRAEVYQAFGRRAPRFKPRGVHPAQPFVPGVFAAAFSGAGRIYALVALGLLLLTWLFGGGTQLLRQDIANVNGPLPDMRFTIDDPDRLLRLELTAPLRNQWGFYEVNILDRQNRPALSLGKEISYYFGREGGESWSEGSQTVNSLFKVPAAGEYRFEIESSEGSRGRPPRLTVELNSGYTVRRYFVILLILCVIAAVLLPAQRIIFSAKRWAPVMEDDDD